MSSKQKHNSTGSKERKCCLFYYALFTLSYLGTTLGVAFTVFMIIKCI